MERCRLRERASDKAPEKREGEKYGEKLIQQRSEVVNEGRGGVTEKKEM